MLDFFFFTNLCHFCNCTLKLRALESVWQTDAGQHWKEIELTKGQRLLLKSISQAAQPAKGLMNDQFIRERERDDWRRRRNGAKYSRQLVLWQKWKTCGINWPIVNLPKESKIFLPGIYYFARDHFHCIARSSRRAAIRGMMEHTCWSLGIISPIFDNWIFDHLIWYLIWAHMLKLIRYLIKHEIFGYKSAISDRFLPSMPSVARS